MILEARGVTHRFESGADILRDVDLTLERGRAVALIGPNGAGKTTLLRIMGGLVEPLAGAVTLEGRAMSSFRRREVAQSISVVPQARPPAFEFTAQEFVLMGFHARSSRFSLDGSKRQSAARAALDAMAVGHLAGRSMTQLSGGEAQRVVMARTIASGAPIWLLDEPTTNLDLGHQLALLDAVRAHCNGGGAALAIVHDPNLVPRWFDHVCVLADGAVAAAGAPDVVLTTAVFESAFGLRMRFVGDENAGAWVPDLDPARASRVEATAPHGDST